MRQRKSQPDSGDSWSRKAAARDSKEGGRRGKKEHRDAKCGREKERVKIPMRSDIEI